MESKNVYRSIFKTTSILGGAQVFSIVIALLRSKMIAFFIGAAGLGVLGLFNTTLELFSTVGLLGIDKSGVKELSFRESDNDKQQEILRFIKSLGLYLGVLCGLCLILLSKYLSILVFENTNYFFGFIWLAIALFFKILTQLNMAILQGIRKMAEIAKITLWGSSLGLVVSAILLYWYDIDAIIPMIIVANVVMFLASYYYQQKENRESYFTNISILVLQIKEHKQLLGLGFKLSISAIMHMMAVYAFQIYLSHVSELEIVGYYIAGMAILNYYVTIVFNAMGTDYYPRLAAIHEDNIKVTLAIREQVVMGVLILLPLIMIFVVFTPLVVRVLYTYDFLAMVNMLRFGVVGMLFRIVSWSIGYVFIAKGDSKIFLKTAVLFNLLFFGLNALGFYFYNLTGLGIAFLVHYIIHFLVLYFIANKKYGFSFDKKIYEIFGISLVLVLVVFFSSFYDDYWLSYVIMLGGALISFIFVLVQLSKIMDLKEVFLKKIKRWFL